jgi:hypothetical protein
MAPDRFMLIHGGYRYCEFLKVQDHVSGQDILTRPYMKLR